VEEWWVSHKIEKLGYICFFSTPSLINPLSYFVLFYGHLSDPLTCDIDLNVKGKEKESEEHHFVSAILEAVL
jgi:hypothetical protein